MKPLYTQDDFNNAKSIDDLLCKCYQCDKSFTQTKHEIQRCINPNNKRTGKYCSKNCENLSKLTIKTISCTNCQLSFERRFKLIKTNNFCSQSCSVTYNNKHKTHGNRRSKLEVWLEEQLSLLYPNLEIHFNRKDTIGSELDIYIPKLKLAFELNGIFHYEPIYGVDKLSKIKENDISKSKACHEGKIDLCLIDTSGQKYFKISTSQKYLDIIINIIKERN